MVAVKSPPKKVACTFAASTVPGSSREMDALWRRRHAPVRDTGALGGKTNEECCLLL